MRGVKNKSRNGSEFQVGQLFLEKKMSSQTVCPHCMLGIFCYIGLNNWFV